MFVRNDVNLQFMYLHSLSHCSSFAQYEGNFPPKVKEEMKKEDEGQEKEAAGNGKLLSRVQELEEELKESEQKRMTLTRDNMALQMQLKASQEEEVRICQEPTKLERLLKSQVRRMVVLSYRTGHQECCVSFKLFLL